MELTRFYIQEEYFGLFGSKHVLCESTDLNSLCLIVDLLVEHFKNRPFLFAIKWFGSDPDLSIYKIFDSRDFTKYFDGIYCI